jgi:hypothetical protein
LIVINEINRNGARPLEGSGIVAPPFYDVDGNRNIEALDVLIVINYINANLGNGEGDSGEGESTAFDSLNSIEQEHRKRRFGVSSIIS